MRYEHKDLSVVERGSTVDLEDLAPQADSPQPAQAADRSADHALDIPVF